MKKRKDPDEYASGGRNVNDGEIYLPATNAKKTKEIFESKYYNRGKEIKQKKDIITYSKK